MIAGNFGHEWSFRDLRVRVMNANIGERGKRRRFQAPQLLHAILDSPLVSMKRPPTHIVRHHLSNENSTEVVHTDVASLNGGLGGTETETDILVPAAALGSLLGRSLSLGVEEDVRLLLESALRLDGQLGGHFCGVVRRGSGVEEMSGWRLSKMRKIRCPLESLVIRSVRH